ncbi:MAG: response regulator [Chloroflexota bacterium]|nr:response regulator [Anaerolineales bacterium]MCB8968586.1 response regulator [Ardenticatenaceae bacterium]
MSTLLPCVVSVEDDDDLYDIIRLTLQTLPIRLYHASTGLEAVDLIRQQKEVDLIILDIMLPDINGWNVLKQVIANGTTPKAIIVLTAQTGATHRVIAHLQEVTAYMTKPFKPSDLREKVIEILRIPPSHGAINP